MIHRPTILIFFALSAAMVACGEGGDTSTSSSSCGAGGAPGAASASGASGSAEASASATSSGAGGAGGEKICPPGPFEADPLPANKTAQKVKGGFKFLEGPVWVAAEGALF